MGNNIKIGSHVSLKAPDMFLGSVKEAVAYGSNCFMVYTGAPQTTRRKPIDQMKIEEALEAMKTAGFNPEDVVIHAPYIVNMANPDPEKRKFSVEFLTKEIERTNAMGAKIIVIHPGAHVKQGEQKGMELLVDSLNKLIEASNDNVIIALETMAGKGTELGATFEQIAYLIENSINKDRVKVCFDTCHVHDGGYDIIGDYEGVLKHFDEVVGLDNIVVFHINDSKNPREAHKDRHENFGYGHIGSETLLKFIHDERFANVPKMLETPWLKFEDGTQAPPYKEEIEMIKNNNFVDWRPKNIIVK